MAIALCTNGHAVPPAFDTCRVCGAPRGAPQAPTAPPGQQLCGNGHPSPLSAPFCAICLQPFAQASAQAPPPMAAPLPPSFAPTGAPSAPAPFGRQLTAEMPPGVPAAALPARDRTGLIVAIALTVIGLITMAAPVTAVFDVPQLVLSGRRVSMGRQLVSECGRPVAPDRIDQEAFLEVAGIQAPTAASSESAQLTAAAKSWGLETLHAANSACTGRVAMRRVVSLAFVVLGWAAFFVLRRRGV